MNNRNLVRFFKLFILFFCNLLLTFRTSFTLLIAFLRVKKKVGDIHKY